ncbi:MAG: DNA polymerase III subunit delta [Erysipelotrichaceae bacterium]|jgi:DNA polymerase-3 subunit delta|nr:DNA polymerase III subunit delta [Bacilli bacterium]NLV28613.1 DNA polymerase III subunit delta [Erysipelotrichaceae bacterium]
MVYLIYGNQTPTIRKRLNAILKERLPDRDEMNYVKYDGSLTLIQECINDANSLPLGYEHKVVVVESCYFLMKPKPRNKIESDQDYDTLRKFIATPSEECDLILVVSSSDVDKTSDIYKEILKSGKVFEIIDPTSDQWNAYVGHYCRDVKKLKIDNDALYELSQRTSGDVSLFQNSVAVLELYTDHISYDDVLKMVARPLDENAFLLFNYLVQKKTSEAVGLFRDLKVANVEPVTLISMLANQFRLLNQISYLYNKGFESNAIASELRINPMRTQIMLRSVRSISQANIRKTLDDLFNLDVQIKSGLVDRFYSFELFLINFKSN